VKVRFRDVRILVGPGERVMKKLRPCVRVMSEIVNGGSLPVADEMVQHRARQGAFARHRFMGR